MTSRSRDRRRRSLEAQFGPLWPASADYPTVDTLHARHGYPTYLVAPDRPSWHRSGPLPACRACGRVDLPLRHVHPWADSTLLPTRIPLCHNCLVAQRPAARPSGDAATTEHHSAAASAPATASAGGARRGEVDEDRVSTLSELAGHVTVRTLGPVTGVAADTTHSGIAAGLRRLRRAAAVLGANAVVGLTSGALLTAGDGPAAATAVMGGVLLIGTAVVVEPVPAGADDVEDSPVRVRESG